MDIHKDLVAASAASLILAIIAEGDTYGYAILKRLSEVSRGELAWTDGMLYPVLHRLERQIEQWREYLRRRQAIRPTDVEELEDHLRDLVETLRARPLGRRGVAGLRLVARLGVAPSPARPLAFPPAEEPERERTEGDHREESRQVARRRESKDADRDDDDVNDQRGPALPLHGRSPAPAIPLGGKPEVFFPWRLSHGPRSLAAHG